MKVGGHREAASIQIVNTASGESAGLICRASHQIVFIRNTFYGRRSAVVAVGARRCGPRQHAREPFSNPDEHVSGTLYYVRHSSTSSPVL